MKAAVIEAIGQPLVVKEVPIPEPGPGKSSSKSKSAAYVTVISTPMPVSSPLQPCRSCRAFRAIEVQAQSKRLARMSLALRSATGSEYPLCIARAGTVNTVLTASICCVALSS